MVLIISVLRYRQFRHSLLYEWTFMHLLKIYKCTSNIKRQPDVKNIQNMQNTVLSILLGRWNNLPRFYLSNYIFKKIHKNSQFNYEKAFIYRYFFIHILSFFIMILFIYIHEAFILSLFCSPLYKRTEDSEEQRLSSRWTNSKNGIFRVCIRDLSPFLNESLYLAN